jgi:hypothetical protein
MNNRAALSARARRRSNYSASEAILIYNQQLHADQSANAIAGDVVKRGRRADGRCGPHSLELCESAVCSFAHAGVLYICIQPEPFSCSNKRTADPSNSASARGRGISNGMYFLGFGQQLQHP